MTLSTLKREEDDNEMSKGGEKKIISLCVSAFTSELVVRQAEPRQSAPAAAQLNSTIYRCSEGAFAPR